MTNDGFSAALVVGLLALLAPVLWIGWWLVADLGKRAYSTYPAWHGKSAEPELRRAA